MREVFEGKRHTFEITMKNGKRKVLVSSPHVVYLSQQDASAFLCLRMWSLVTFQQMTGIVL